MQRLYGKLSEVIIIVYSKFFLQISSWNTVPKLSSLSSPYFWFLQSLKEVDQGQVLVVRLEVIPVILPQDIAAEVDLITGLKEIALL